MKNSILDYEQVNQILDNFSKDKKFIELSDLGNTEKDLPIRHFKVGNGKSDIVITGATHGSEIITTDFILKLMSDIKNNEKEWNNVLKEFTIHLIPMLNPEGYLISSCAVRKLIPRDMEQEEAELLKQVQQIRFKRGKEKLKLISNGENILISFEEWRALKEPILAKAKNNNIGGLISWKEYRYNPYGNYTELDEYVIRLQNQLLHIYEYENQIQANLEQLTEERKEMLERKAQEDSKEDEMIGWKKILGNQYSLEESFDIEAVEVIGVFVEISPLLLSEFTNLIAAITNVPNNKIIKTNDKRKIFFCFSFLSFSISSFLLLWSYNS